jgi:hypothetical protein
MMITTLLGPMSLATADTVAQLAGYLTLVCVLPLCWQTWRGLAHPAAVTWGIWAPVGYVATVGMALGGTLFSEWFPKACLSSGPLLVFIVAAWKGGPLRVDRSEHPKTVATLGVAGTICYVLIYFGVVGPADPKAAGELAVCTAIAVDMVGAWPTWVRGWRKPYGELIKTYGLAVVSVIAALLVAPRPWTFLGQGIYVFLLCQMLSIITVLAAGRVRIARGYSDQAVGHPGVA